MTQLHKRFTDEQIRLLFKRFCEGLMTRMEIEEIIDDLTEKTVPCYENKSSW
jgi:hypothetical protein